MRVLLQSRSSLLSTRGGDTVIVEKTRDALARRGVDAVVGSDPDVDLERFDLVHLFNVAHPDSYPQALNARRQGRPIVVTTIYWNQDGLLTAGSLGRSDYVEPLRYRVRRVGWALFDELGIVPAKKARRRRRRSLYYERGFHGMAQSVIDLADVLLPGSESEQDMLQRSFRIDADKAVRIAPYGIDLALFDRPVPDAANRFLRKHQRRDFLLCVGRVEPRKNQAALLEAAVGLDLPVVLVGESNDSAYTRQVRERLSARDLWVESWSHEAMAEIYALARLHALPSFNETPGLVSLEAGAMGVPVVVGNRGAERDYLGDHAEYCDPDDVADIRRALAAALERPRPDPALADHIRSRFTWEQHADRVLATYEAVTSGGPGAGAADERRSPQRWPQP